MSVKSHRYGTVPYSTVVRIFLKVALALLFVRVLFLFLKVVVALLFVSFV